MKSAPSFVSLFFSAFLCFVTVIDASGGPAVNEQSLPVNRIREGNLLSNRELANALDRWVKAIENGNRIDAIEQTDHIRDIMKMLGTTDLIPASDLCIAVGRASMARGDMEGATLAGHNATLFAPNHPDAYFFLADALFKKDKKNINSALYSLVTGLKVTMADRIERESFLGSALKYVIVNLIITFLVTFLALLTVYYRALFADIASFLPSNPESYWRVIAGLMVVLAPLAIGGWLVFILVLPLLLWPYLQNSSRVIVALFAALVFSGPYAVNQMAKGVTIRSDDTFRALYLLSGNTWDYETKTALEKELKADPDNTLISFALGLLNNLRKNKEASIAAYDTILRANPNDVRALVNKGNVYFAAKEWDNAAAMYKEAIKINDNSVEAHYNLSKAYTEMFANKDSDAEYQKARSIDPKRTDSFRAQAIDNPDRKVINFTITSDDLKNYERNLAHNVSVVSNGMWDKYFGVITQDIYQAMTSAFVILMGASLFLWQRRIPHYMCSSCGTAFCPPIHLSSTAPKCNQCVAAQSSRAGVSSAKKDKKRKEIIEFKNRRSQIASLLDRLAPGIGRTWFLDTAVGFALTAVTISILVYSVMTIFEDIIVQESSPALVAQNHVIFLGMAVVYWIVMNTAFKRDFF